MIPLPLCNDGAVDSGQPRGHEDHVQWLSESLDVFRGNLLQSDMEKSFSVLGAETQR